VFQIGLIDENIFQPNTLFHL